MRSTPAEDGDPVDDRAGWMQSRLVKIGAALLIFGTGPLLFIIAAAAAGLWPDPNPNPIGPGLLAAVTFWPGVICIAVGIVRAFRR